MENITMTNATQILRPVSGCPQVAVRRLVAGLRVRVQGIAVSTLGFAGFGSGMSVVVALAPAFYAPIAQVRPGCRTPPPGETPGLAPPDQVTSRPRNPTSGIRGLCVVRRPATASGTPHELVAR